MIPKNKKSPLSPATPQRFVPVVQNKPLVAQRKTPVPTQKVTGAANGKQYVLSHPQHLPKVLQAKTPAGNFRAENRAATPINRQGPKVVQQKTASPPQNRSHVGQRSAVVQRYIKVGIMRCEVPYVIDRLRQENSWDESYRPVLARLNDELASFRTIKDLATHLSETTSLFNRAHMGRYTGVRLITLQAWDNQASGKDPGHMQMYDLQQQTTREYRITDRPFFYDEDKKHRLMVTPQGAPQRGSVCLEGWVGPYEEGNKRQIDREWANKKRFTRFLEVTIRVTEAEFFKLQTLYVIRRMRGAAHYYGESGVIDPLSAKCMSFLTDLANMRGWKVPLMRTVFEMLMAFADRFRDDVVSTKVTPVVRD